MDSPKRRTLAQQRAHFELLGTTGAGVLGAGIGLLLSRYLGSFVVPILIVGGITHAWAMYAKHRLDSVTGPAPPRWAEIAYWSCWLLLLALAAYIWQRGAW